MWLWMLGISCAVTSFLCGYFIGLDKGERKAHQKIVEQQLVAEKRRKASKSRLRSHRLQSMEGQSPRQSPRLRLVKEVYSDKDDG